MSFCAGMGLAIRSSWAVVASEKVRSRSLTSVALAIDGDASQNFDVRLHKGYKRIVPRRNSGGQHVFTQRWYRPRCSKALGPGAASRPEPATCEEQRGWRWWSVDHL